MTNNTNQKVDHNLSVITGLHFAKSTLRQLNSVTFIYDPNWNPDDYSYPTLPTCFFHLKKMTEVLTSEISQKPLLFYNSQGGSSSEGVGGAVLNVVADNIVIKPKVYKLDVLIPYNNISMLSRMTQNTLETVPTVMSTLFTGGAKEGAWTSYVAPWLSMSQSYLNIMKDIVKQVATMNISDNWLNDIMSTPDYNKMSLEAMWRSRRILKLKNWNGWSYKYVAIVDVETTKEGTDDGVYEATITVQEVPMITIKDSLMGLQKFKSTRFTNVAGKAMVNALDNAERTINKIISQ